MNFEVPYRPLIWQAPVQINPIPEQQQGEFSQYLGELCPVSIHINQFFVLRHKSTVRESNKLLWQKTNHGTFTLITLLKDTENLDLQ